MNRGSGSQAKLLKLGSTIHSTLASENDSTIIYVFAAFMFSPDVPQVHIKPSCLTFSYFFFCYFDVWSINFSFTFPFGWKQMNYCITVQWSCVKHFLSKRENENSNEVLKAQSAHCRIAESLTRKTGTTWYPASAGCCFSGSLALLLLWLICHLS